MVNCDRELTELWSICFSTSFFVERRGKGDAKNFVTFLAEKLKLVFWKVDTRVIWVILVYVVVSFFIRFFFFVHIQLRLKMCVAKKLVPPSAIISLVLVKSLSGVSFCSIYSKIPSKSSSTYHTNSNLFHSVFLHFFYVI